MRIFFVWVLMVVASTLVYSQTTLSFCAGIDNERCAFNNTKFISVPDSSTAKIFMMVSGNNDQTLATGKLIYKLYSVNKKGEETYINTLEQSIQPEWIYAWQPAFFNTPGKYTVTVYNDANRILNTKSFELFDR
ncbi:MAG: hypothetical protein U0T74_10925 [Chitinophagales bacterium]